MSKMNTMMEHLLPALAAKQSNQQPATGNTMMSYLDIQMARYIKQAMKGRFMVAVEEFNINIMFSH